MLGQPYSMVLPEVIGVKLTGKLKEGITATDLVLTVTQMLRKRGVVGKFVEFFGPGLAGLTIADRATLGNMAPEYGATCGFFPIDDDTMQYLDDTNRSKERIDLVKAYAQAQGMYRTKTTQDPIFTDVLKLELGSRRAVARRPEAPAGPRCAQGSEVGLRRLDGQGVQQGGRDDQARAGRRPRPRSRPRRRGDRCDHLLHQHVESERDGRRRPGGQEGGRQGPQGQAVGEDLAGAGLASRRGLLRKVGLAEGSRRAGLQPGRLRLHHLHRQLRAAAGGNFRSDQPERSGRRRGAVRQPQLRRPRQRRRARELSRLAAAGGRLCDRRLDEHRRRQGRARSSTRRARRSSSRTSGRPAARSTP